MKFFNIAVKKAPIPAISAFLVYIIFSQIIEKSSDSYLLIIISILTFFSIFLILLIPEYKNYKISKMTSYENNSLSDIEVDSGDAFIGENGSIDNDNLKMTNNSIEKVKAKKGDVYIGRKGK